MFSTIRENLIWAENLGTKFRIFDNLVIENCKGFANKGQLGILGISFKISLTMLINSWDISVSATDFYII